MRKSSIVSLFLLFWLGVLSASANVRLPSVLGNHMVLQQKSEVTLWGWCDATEKIKITVEWDTTVYQVVGSRNATWSVKVKTPAAGGPYKITFTGRNVIVLEDVLIGEVWLGSGQSNMEWNVNANLKQAEGDPANPSIRFFHVLRTTADYPQDDVPGQWVVCAPENLKYFSAVCYFFGKKLQHELNVPVGLISSSWGGSPAEVWTPKEIFENDAVLKAAAAKISSSYPGWPIEPGKAYNAMINPVTKFTIAGVLWYQGETNVGTNSTYTQLLSAMIGAWRKNWNIDFPFYLVQLAPYTYGNHNVGALLRDAQTKVLTVPKTGMVVISDLVDDVKNIHPANKLDVGLRLASYALADTYGKKGLAYKSPQYKNMVIEKNKIRVSFDNAEGGLITKGGAPTEFYIAGDDQIFLPATAKIEKNTIIVSNPTVKNPQAVRFGFSNTAMPNLFSKEGLPVNLFRTDTWVVNTDAIPK
jgi:sialate O-acetylesterase